MLDWKEILENKEKFEKLLIKRGSSVEEAQKALKNLNDLKEKRSAAIVEIESLRGAKNSNAAESGKLFKEGKKEQAQKFIDEGKKINHKIQSTDEELKTVEKDFNFLLMNFPNWLDDSVPKGNSEKDNRLVKEWGKIEESSFKVLEHDEWGRKTELIDFDRAAKVSGSRFVYLKSGLARLERALINFMLDEHRSRGYTEISPPTLVQAKTLLASSQLPKFAEDLYKVEEQDKYLIPTSEVVLNGFHMEEILPESKLPKKYMAYTMNYRSEAGSYGKDTKGMIRQHQFGKVELFKFVKPEESDREHEALLLDAENILQKLDLPYRVVELCSGDIGFSAKKTYDIEVWLPASLYEKEERGCYREISSCSNCGDFQARRSKTRYKDSISSKNQYLHTLNGSGLAVGRCLVAIIENYQNEDGSLRVPAILQDFMKAKVIVPS